jgi:hypothetical protein
MGCKPTLCHCGKLLDGGNPQGRVVRPRAGELTVCVRCATVFVFLDGGELEPLTAAQLEELPGNAIRAIRELRRVIEARRS